MTQPMFPPPVQSEHPADIVRAVRECVAEDGSIDEDRVRALVPSMDRVVDRINQAEAQRNYELAIDNLETAA